MTTVNSNHQKNSKLFRAHSLGSPYKLLPPMSEFHNHRSTPSSQRGADTKLRFYADWIDRLLRKQRGEKVHIDLKQALPDGVLLADLIFTLTKSVVPEIDRNPHCEEDKFSNVQRCLVHLRDLGHWKGDLNPQDFVLFKSKAITDVLDSLFRIQWNSSNKADFMPGLPKEGKRASGLQPPSAAMVSNRRFINPKAGSSSPLPVRCSTTGKMYKQRSEADHNVVMQSNRIPSHTPHSCPTDQNKYGYHYPSETHTIGTSGIIRPGLISGTKSNFVDLSALSRRASSVSYRSSISSSQSEATSNCSTPTGVGGVDEAQSPAVPRSSFSLRYDVQQSPATPVPCTGPPKEPSWPNQPIQMIRQDQYSRPEAPQEWSQPASSCYQSSGPSHPPNEFHSQPVMMVRPKVSYRDHLNVRDAGQLGFSGKSLQFRLPFYGDADERRRLKAFNKKRQKSTDVEKTESRAEGSSGNVSSSTGSSRTHQAFGKSDGTCLANDPPDSHTQEPIDAIQANRIIGKSNFRDPVTNQFSSNAKNDLYYPTAHAHFQPIPLHPFPPQHSVNGRGSEPPPSSHVNCPALSWVQNTQRRVSIVAAPTQYDAPKETRSHRSGAGLSRDLLPTTVQSAIRNTPSDASNTFVNLSPYLQNEHPQTTPPDGSNTTPHIYYGRTALNLSKMTAPADLNLLRLPAKRISLDEISSIALSATEPVQPVLRKPASPQKTPSLPSSNSASSSLSAGEDKNFCDSGISSSSYSKDSACTSPSENPSNKGALSIGVCLNSSLSSQNESSGASEKSVPLTVSDSSVSLEQWDNCRAKSVEPPSNCSDRIRSVLSSSKLQRPTTGVKPPHSSVPKMLEPMVSRDSECAKILSRQRAKELYSVVKNRENHKLITASPKLRASSVCSKMNTCETSLSLPGQSRPVRPQSLRKPSSELIAVTSNSNQLIFSPCTSEPNNIYITEDVGQQLCMPDRDVNDNHGQGQINTQEDHAHVSQLPAVNGNKTGDQPPLDKTDATYSVCPTGLPPMNRTTMYPAQNCRQPGPTHENFCLNSHAVTSVADMTHFQLVQTEPNKSSEAKLEKTPTSGIECDYRSLDHVKGGTSSPELIYKDPSTLSLSDSKSNLYAPFSDFALLTKGSKSETAGFTDAGGNMIDPDQLLSSLSKLNLDAGANGPLWDKTCFSDVESEYAALELLLPLPKIPTDQQERLPPKSSFDESSSQSFFEPGYYSDTEAAFTNQQAPRPSTVLGSFIDRRQGGSVFGSPSTNARLPIASVAPIMAETKQTRASNSSIYAHSNLSAPCSHGQPRDSFAKSKHPNSEADTGSEPPLGLDSLHCLEDTKWPRLRSAQSVSHSLSTDRANSVTSVSGPYAHKPNVLENVKLPYPMGPLNLNHGVCSQSLQVVRPSISNYALHRKNSCSAGFSVPDTASKETGCLGGMDTPPGFLSCGERMFGSGIPSCISALETNTSQIETQYTQIEVSLVDSWITTVVIFLVFIYISLCKVERLRRELKRSKEQIFTLTSQLSIGNRAEHASEQNLENLTAKIQQLTTLNTMKDSEIRELRKTIDQLKNEVQKVHSSQRNGVGSMMRAPRSISCTHPDKTLQHGVQDSTSLTSLTSGVSGVSQDTNPGSTSSSGEAAEGHSPSPNPDTDANSGKRSRWIRSSIGKAFKKRSRSTMNADERTVVPDEQLVRQNSVAGSTATVCNSPILSRNSTSQLTDQSHTCSEALSYLSDNVDHGESLRNIMLRMRWEMNCLEADNQRLRRFVLNCPALTEPPSTGHRSNSRPVTISDLCNRYCSSSAEQRIRVLVELERPTITAAIELPQSTSETSSVLKSPVASNRVLGELGDGDRKTKTLKVGFVGLTREDGWENLDAAIVKLWEDYIKFFDPDQKLIPKPPKVTDYQLEAATQNSTTVAVIHHRLISEHEKEKRGDGSDKSHSHTRSPSLWLTRIKENNPNSSLGFIATLHIVSAPQQSDSGLDDGDHGSVGLDPPSLITLIPRKTLEDYLSQIKTHRFVVFCGPTGTGKSHAARKIAEYLTGRRTSSEAIRIFGASHNGFPTAKEMRLFLNRYLEAFRTNGVPQVIILENLHRVQGSVTEAVDAQGSSDFKSWPIVLATSDLRNDELQNLQSQFPIKIVDHLVDLDSSSEFLGRFLRRKLAQARMFEEADAPGAETAQREENNTLVQLVNWIPKVWKHINQLANLHQKQSPTVFGLKVFLACPIGVDSSKNWFMDLWNNLFVPFLFKARTSDAKVMESFSATLAESFDWIVATWPWPRTISDALLQSTDSTPTIESSTYSLLSLTAPKILGGRNDSHNRTSLDSGIMSDGLPSLGGQSSSNAAHFETKAPRESEHPETFLHETHLAEPMGPVYTHQTEVERISTDTSQQRPNTSSSSNRKRSLEMTDGHATFIPLPKEVFPPLVKSATLDSSISSTDKI